LISRPPTIRPSSSGRKDGFRLHPFYIDAFIGWGFVARSILPVSAAITEAFARMMDGKARVRMVLVNGNDQVQGSNRRKTVTNVSQSLN
jgi:hypothetical protein